MMSFRTGVADPTDLAMLTRVIVTIANEMGVEESSPKYGTLASHLLLLFEACKDEERLLTLMRKSVGKLDRPPVYRRSHAGDPPER